MTWIVDSSGSQTAVISTEHSLATPTTIGNYRLSVDTVNLVNGDLLELRCYDMVDGTNYRQVYKGTYQHIQTNVGKISPDVAVTTQGKFTLKQTAGTGRVFPWSLRRDTHPANFNLMVIDGSGRVDVSKIGGTAQTARDIGASVLLAAGQKVDVDTIKTNPVVNAGTVTFPTGATLASTTNITAGTIATVTTVTNQLTAAVIASAIWKDTTAGDFTVASSIGKSLYTSGNAPGAASGLALVGSNMGTISGALTGAQIATAVWTDTTAGDFTTSLSVGKSVMNGVTLGTGLTVASVSGAVGSVTGLTASNLDTTISSRMATYTQPTGFLSATFPTGTVANTTNITAGTITTATNLTNAPTAGDFTSTMKTGLNAATPVATLSGDLTATMKTSVTTAATAATPTAAAVTGAVGSVTGAVGSVTGAVGSVTGNVGGNVTGSIGALATQAKTDVENAVWDATMSSHVTSLTTGATLNGAGAAGDPWTTALPGAYGAGTAGNIVGNNLNATVSSRLASTGYTAPDNTSVSAIKTKTDSLTFTVAGKVDANIKAVNSVTVNGDGSATPWGP